MVAPLPPDARPTVACAYDFLKGLPGAKDPGVYFVENKTIVIAFGYLHNDGKDRTHELLITKRSIDGRYIADGDLPEDLSLALTGIESRCHLMTGYDDEIIITGPDSDPHHWLVDMSKVPRE